MLPNSIVLSHWSVSDSLQPTNCSPPASSVHWILQARIRERVAMASFRGSCQPKDQIRISCTAGEFFTIWASRKALLTPLKMGNSLTNFWKWRNKNQLQSLVSSWPPWQCCGHQNIDKNLCFYTGTTDGWCVVNSLPWKVKVICQPLIWETLDNNLFSLLFTIDLRFQT